MQLILFFTFIICIADDISDIELTTLERENIIIILIKKAVKCL